jgi:two-component sensor histidine kinase
MMRAVESSQRGYVLTSRREFLEPYAKYNGRVLPLFERLSEQRPPELDGAPSLVGLKPLVEEKLDEMRESIELVDRGLLNQAIERIRQGYGKRIMDAIQRGVEQIQSYGRKMLWRNQAVTARFERIKVYTDIVGALLVISFSTLSLILLIRTNSELEKAQDALEMANNELEDTVQERTAALKRANDEIQRFAYIVSHDLRSPLVNIMGFTAELETLRNELFDQLKAAGAADYVVKDLQGEFLDLLESAVTSALASAEIRRARDAAEAEVRRARDQFKALAEERALLLREVNHRVSNSLQLIASVLHFQADISESRAVKDALKEANSRVMAVARVHRWLYVSDNVRAVSLGDYLQTLIDDLEGVTGAPLRAPISIRAEPIEVDPDKAVAVGIIATELILNAFKHAYPEGTGPVRVSLTRNGGSTVALVVEDEGVGAMNGTPSGFSSKPGLGQRIIRGMAEKLEGELIYDASRRGTRATLVFPALCAPAGQRADASAVL